MRHQAWLAQKQDNGLTRRENFEARPDNPDAIRGLRGTEMPESLRYLWVWWSELAGVRRMGAHGLDPIGFVDIDAWARLTGRRPQPHEVQGILRVDKAMLNPEGN